MSTWITERLKDWRSWSVSLLLHLAVMFSLWHTLISLDQSRELVGAIDAELGGEGAPIAFENAEPALLNIEPLARDDRPDWRQGAADAFARVDRAGQGDVVEPVLSDAVLKSGELAVEREGKPGAIREAPAKSPRAAQRKGTAAKEQMPELAGSLDGRQPGERAKLVKSAGGTRASEEAVELGLVWLARYQRTDGSWSFQHGPDDPGVLDCPTGATGLALLAFLGAGYTQTEGPYQQQVHAGLKYLMEHMELNESGGWMLGTGLATMYVQAIGAMALCEAFSMTKDPSLQRHAQLAIDFICKAQDSDGGGWRYRIPQAGDTSVFGWQLMALKSAKVAELKVPPRVITRATKFLKSVESEGGAAFGYTHPGNVRPTMTAVGLLCRMYLGRDQTHHGMIRGIRRLSDMGPTADDMYYSYYATQAMRHWGGSAWEKWNPVMREQLISSQSHSGDSAGSWRIDQSHHAEMGGRLYTTCLSIMTLEVYYRYLPLYRPKAVSQDF